VGDISVHLQHAQSSEESQTSLFSRDGSSITVKILIWKILRSKVILELSLSYSLHTS